MRTLAKYLIFSPLSLWCIKLFYHYRCLILQISALLQELFCGLFWIKWPLYYYSQLQRPGNFLENPSYSVFFFSVHLHVGLLSFLLGFTNYIIVLMGNAVSHMSIWKDKEHLRYSSRALFRKFLIQTNSPEWQFSEAEFISSEQLQLLVTNWNWIIITNHFRDLPEIWQFDFIECFTWKLNSSVKFLS